MNVSQVGPNRRHERTRRKVVPPGTVDIFLDPTTAEVRAYYEKVAPEIREKLSPILKEIVGGLEYTDELRKRVEPLRDEEKWKLECERVLEYARRSVLSLKYTREESTPEDPTKKRPGLVRMAFDYFMQGNSGDSQMDPEEAQALKDWLERFFEKLKPEFIKESLNYNGIEKWTRRYWRIKREIKRMEFPKHGLDEWVESALLKKDRKGNVYDDDTFMAEEILRIFNNALRSAKGEDEKMVERLIQWNEKRRMAEMESFRVEATTILQAPEKVVAVEINDIEVDIEIVEEEVSQTKTLKDLKRKIEKLRKELEKETILNVALQKSREGLDIEIRTLRERVNTLEKELKTIKNSIPTLEEEEGFMAEPIPLECRKPIPKTPSLNKTPLKTSSSFLEIENEEDAAPPLPQGDFTQDNPSGVALLVHFDPHAESEEISLASAESGLHPDPVIPLTNESKAEPEAEGATTHHPADEVIDADLKAQFESVIAPGEDPELDRRIEEGVRHRTFYPEITDKKAERKPNLRPTERAEKSFEIILNRPFSINSFIKRARKIKESLNQLEERLEAGIEPSNEELDQYEYNQVLIVKMDGYLAEVESEAIDYYQTLLNPIKSCSEEEKNRQLEERLKIVQEEIEKKQDFSKIDAEVKSDLFHQRRILEFIAQKIRVELGIGDKANEIPELDPDEFFELEPDEEGQEVFDLEDLLMGNGGSEEPNPIELEKESWSAGAKLEKICESNHYIPAALRHHLFLLVNRRNRLKKERSLRHSIELEERIVNYLNGTEAQWIEENFGPYLPLLAFNKKWIAEEEIKTIEEGQEELARLYKHARGIINGKMIDDEEAKNELLGVAEHSLKTNEAIKRAYELMWTHLKSHFKSLDSKELENVFSGNLTEENIGSLIKVMTEEEKGKLKREVEIEVQVQYIRNLDKKNQFALAGYFYKILWHQAGEEQLARPLSPKREWQFMENWNVPFLRELINNCPELHPLMEFKEQYEKLKWKLDKSLKARERFKPESELEREVEKKLKALGIMEIIQANEVDKANEILSLLRIHQGKIAIEWGETAEAQLAMELISESLTSDFDGSSEYSRHIRVLVNALKNPILEPKERLQVAEVLLVISLRASGFQAETGAAEVHLWEKINPPKHHTPSSEALMQILASQAPLIQELFKEAKVAQAIRIVKSVENYEDFEELIQAISNPESLQELSRAKETDSNKILESEDHTYEELILAQAYKELAKKIVHLEEILLLEDAQRTEVAQSILEKLIEHRAQEALAFIITSGQHYFPWDQEMLKRMSDKLEELSEMKLDSSLLDSFRAMLNKENSEIGGDIERKLRREWRQLQDKSKELDSDVRGANEELWFKLRRRELLQLYKISS